MVVTRNFDFLSDDENLDPATTYTVTAWSVDVGARTWSAGTEVNVDTYGECTARDTIRAMVSAASCVAVFTRRKSARASCAPHPSRPDALYDLATRGDGCAAAARCGSTNAGQLGGAAGDVGRVAMRWLHDGATDEEMVCVTGSGLRGGRVGARGESDMPVNEVEHNSRAVLV